MLPRARDSALPTWGSQSSEGAVVTTLRLVHALESEKHDGEAFACTYSPDGGFVVSAGWDGHLRLWEVSSGTHLSSLRAGMKPLSACTTTPDGKRWVAGT